MSDHTKEAALAGGRGQEIAHRTEMEGAHETLQLQKRDFNVFRAGYADFIKRGFAPRKDTKPVKLILPIDWDMDPLRDRNWCFQLHAWRMLQPIWSEFYEKDWGRLKGELLPWIRDWYDYHVRKKRKSKFMWYDMAAGLRAQNLALLLLLHQRGILQFDIEELAELEQLAAMHITKLRDPSFISSGNHGIFQLVGLRLLGIVWEGRAETEGEEAYSCGLMGSLLRSQFGPQGVHVENSPDYHNFALVHFRRIRPELFPGISDLFRKKISAAEEVAPWFTFPNGSISCIGDSEGVGVPFRSPTIVDARSTTGDGDAVLLRDLSSGGYSVVRTAPEVPDDRAQMLIVKAQAFTNSHAHADHLGFELFSFGLPLFVDSGKFTYNKDAWRRYFVCDRAHNVIGLRDQSFGPYDTKIGSSGISSSSLEEGGRYVIAGQACRGEFFCHRRRFEYLPGHYLKIEDEVEVRDSDVPVAYFHLAPGVDAEVSDNGVELLRNGARVALISCDRVEFTPILINGQVDPYIQGWVSPSYKKRISATVVEMRGEPGMTKWVFNIQLFKPGPVSSQGLLQRPLPAGISIAFPYVCSVDKVLLHPGGGTERRVIVEFFSGSAQDVDEKTRLEIESRGFKRLRSRLEQGGVRIYYHREDGIKINVLIRPDTAFKVRSPTAKGSVYFAFSKEPNPPSETELGAQLAREATDEK